MKFIPTLGLVATATASMASDFARNAAGVKENAPKGNGGLRGGRGLARGERAGRAHKQKGKEVRTPHRGPRPQPKPKVKPNKDDEPPPAEADIPDDEEEEAFEEEFPEVDQTPTPRPGKSYSAKEPKLKESSSRPDTRPGGPGKSTTPIEEEEYATESGKKKKVKEKKVKEKKRDQTSDDSEAQSFARLKGESKGSNFTKNKPPRQSATKPDKDGGSPKGDGGRVKMAKEERQGKPKKQIGPPEDASMREWPPTPLPTFAVPNPPPSPEPTTPAPVWADEAEETEEETEGIVLYPCPPEYDPSHTSYVAGNFVGMNGHVFVCLKPPHEEYCSVAEQDESWDDATELLWLEAWSYEGPCEETQANAADLPAEEAAEETVEEGMDDTGALIGDEVAILDEMTTSATTATGGEEIAILEVSEAPADATSAATTTEATTTEATTTEATTTEATTTTTTSTTTATTEATTTEATAITTTSTTTGTTTTTTEEDTAMISAATEADNPIPTEYPTTVWPTYAPTGPMPDCPPAFDPAVTYAAGDISEVREHIFECRDELHEPWCNIAEWNSSYITEEFPNAKDLWRDAWVHVGPCAPVTLEQQMEIGALVAEIEADEAWLET